MPDCLEARRRPLCPLRTAHLSAASVGPIPHRSASSLRYPSSEHRTPGPVAETGHSTKPRANFSTRSVPGGVSDFLRSILSGPTCNTSQTIDKVSQSSAGDPVPVRNRDGVERRFKAKRESRSAGETDKVAATRVNGSLQHVTATQTQTTVPSKTRPPSPARQRCASVARLAASPAGPVSLEFQLQTGPLDQDSSAPSQGGVSPNTILHLLA